MGTLVARGQQLDSIPDRGFQSSGSYALSDIETVNTINGDLTLRVPLASLPQGRGGNPGFTLQLLYNSKLWDSRTDIAPDPLDPRRTVDVHWLNNSTQGGWLYNLTAYVPVLDNRNSHYDNPCPVTQPCGIYIYKLRVGYPDGSMHEFRPVGFSDGLADGYYSVAPGPNMTYYSTDGTFTRLEYGANGSVWTLFFPDGTRVSQPASGGQRTYDRNDNYTELQFVSNYNNTGHPATKIVDQMGRYIAIESNGNDDYIHAFGVGGTEVVTTVRWKRVYVSKTYNARTHFTFNDTLEDLPLRVVDQIILSPQVGGDLRYTFGYNAPSAPSGGAPSYGWGELNSITLPSGAQSTYQYNMDGQNGGAAGPDLTYKEVLKNFPTRKDLNYTLEYDGTTAPAPTQTWFYSTGDTSSSVTVPDGGVTTEWFGNTDPDSAGWDRGLVYKSARPDGTVVERLWQENRPGIEGIPSNVGVNTYVKREYMSIPNAAGAPARTAIKEFNYDKNGNPLRVAEYDWVNYADVTRDASGRPTGIPASAALKRENVNTYHVSTPDASVVGNATGTYHYRGSPRLLRAVKSAEEGPGGGQKLTRAEFVYDSATTTGNLKQQLMWDSTKGPYSNPLSASNSVSLLFQYDAYGNVTLSTDARNVQTQLVYGNVGGFTSLYPTETRIAYGTPVERTQSAEYDFSTGLVTRSTDVDNNVSTSTTYDVFGRPTLTKVAEGKAEEVWTSITYSDVSRRIIARSDLNALGDGKLVSIKHYDQLGRPRLARQLENATTQTAEDETSGIKVQVRYTISGGFNYQLSSQPYRAATSNIATEGPRGWTRTKQDAGGRAVEVQTFRGNTLPAPWGGNTGGTGAMTTSYDAEFTTVADQAGRVRRKMVDALGRLVRLDEPDANTNNLGPTTSPVQPTFYTYNALSKLTQVTQGSQTRTYQYSSLSRLISQTSPETGTVTFTLDAGGNMLSRTDANGVTTNYTYDELGRNKTVDYLNTAVSPDIERYYDGATYGKGRFWYNYAGGNWGAGSNVEHFAVDTYDALGRPKAQRRLFKYNGVWGADFIVRRVYDLAGNVRSQTYPSGRVVTYGYDETGRVNDFRGNLGDGVQRVYSTDIAYDEQSRMKEERFGTLTPLYHKLHYNSRGQLYDIRLSTVPWSTDQWQWNRGALVSYYNANYAWEGDPNAAVGTDNNGNVRLEQHWLSADDAVSSYAYTQDAYDYDYLNRLTSATEVHGGLSGQSGPDFAQAYVYDRWGNRTINASSWGGVPEPQFEVEQATNRLYAPGDSQRTPQTKLMRYEVAGNLIYDAFTGQGTRAYDQENRLVSAQDIYGQTSTYSYDADGRRLRRKAANEEWWQIYGMAGELIAEYRAGAAPMAPTKEYGYHGKELLVTMSSGDDQRLKRFVTNLYYGALRRDPIAQELADASNQFAVAGAQGQSQLLGKAKQVARALFTQTSYETASPARTDAQYVSDLYYTYMQRAADDSGLGWWVSQLASKGRSGVCDDFQNSIEFDVLVTTLYGAAQSDNQRTEQFVKNFYLGAYGRFPTEPELQQQRDALNVAAAQGQSQVQSQAEAMGRALFAAQAADLSLPAQQFVTNLYEGFLQRGPDAGGLSFWTAQAGTTVAARQAVLSSFATCPPFRELSGALYRETFWLVSDIRGTPRMVVDKSGSAAGVKRHDYLPFGEELYAGMGGRAPTQGYSQTDNVRQQFTGKERDASTGLDYSVNRYYSSAQGRFTTADPAFITSQRIADPQMLNLYAYVRNNPLRYVDPDGMELYVLGPEAQTFVDDLERATGLQLHYDPVTQQVTVVGRVPKRMSRDAQRLYDLIKDKTNVVHMLTIRSALQGSRPGRQLIALVGQQNRGATNSQGQFVSYHIIDYDDVDKFNKPHGSQAPQIALHEVLEAYEAALHKITGMPQDDTIHKAAIVYENASRARVPGLGQRGPEGHAVDAQGNPVITPQGYEGFYIDYTSHVEIYMVDPRTLNVLDVKVEKKQQQPQRRRK